MSTRLTPQQTIMAVANKFRDELSAAAGSTHQILTPALQAHTTKAVAAIMSKTVTLAVKSPTINPGARSEQANVNWELLPQGNEGAPTKTVNGVPVDELDNPFRGETRAPDRFDIVSTVDRENPGLIFYDPRAFTELVVERLHAIDPKFGYKSRRNGPVSEDTIGYDVGMKGYVEAIDIIVDAGGVNPRPNWTSYGIVEGDWWRP